MAASTNGKSTAKQPAKAPKNSPTPAAPEMDSRWSILLFILGLLLVVLSLVPGESGWAWFRQNILFGAFGIAGWVIGPLLIYWGALVGLQKPVVTPIIRGVLLMLALTGLATVFNPLDGTGLKAAELLAAVVEQAGTKWFSGGLLGLVLGGLLLVIGGTVVARILMVLLLLLALLIFSGRTPGDLIRSIQAAWQGRPPKAEKPARAPRPAPQPAAPAPAQRQPRTQLTPTPLVRKNRRVDIDLGPDSVASAPGGGNTADGEVFIGPGGTFGQNPLHGKSKAAKQPGGGEDTVDLVFDFSGRRGGQSPLAAQDSGPDIMLFGEDDPLAVIGGPDSLLRDAKLPDDVEYVPLSKPAPDPTFDLFHNNASKVAATTEQEAPDTAQPPPVQPVAFGDAPGIRPAAGDDDSLFDDSPPFDVEDGAADPAPGEVTVTVLDPAVNKLIDSVEAKRVADQQAARSSGAPELRSQYGSYVTPPIDQFMRPEAEPEEDAREELTRTADLLVSTLESFGVKTRILDISRGPSVTRYEVQPQAGVKISRITGLADDIALNLAAAGVRIEAPIPGKPAVGIEVPNQIKNTVAIRSIFESAEFRSADTPLPVALGKDIAGDCIVADLTRMPHLLIAGSTGSGKSVCVNSIIMSFLYRSTPEQVKLLLIDPKVVELAEYNGIPHLLMPVVTEPRKAAGALGSAVAEMERRYHLFAENNVREIKGFNKIARREGLEPLPYIAIVIDELADLMMTSGKEVEDYICRIAQKARAAGMHLIVATQRPSVDVITGLIKANIPSRIAFAVSSQVDSRTILDGGGAEKLLGMGDMLFMPVGANKPVRIQGTYVRDSEITGVLDYIKAHSESSYDEEMIQEMERRAAPEAAEDGDADEGLLKDPTFVKAVETALEMGQISTSMLQRRLSIGYARAGRIMDGMEQLGIVSGPDGSKPRQVLIGRDQWLEMNISAG